ncbi:HAD-IB family hydrolase [Streptomyces sp. NPDC049813]|uniref:HAD-IB family hydrolase n=1 Tax=Streptomyces sp. NPDC049813 TaxID=3365597 RepID=UPI0037A4A9A3
MSSTATRTEPAYLVFSDVDETLIDCKSVFDFLHFALVRLHGAEGETLYRTTRSRFETMAAAGVARAELNRAYYRTAWAGYRAQRLTELGRAWFAQRGAQSGFFIEETLDALRRHQAQGAAVVLVSGSFGACVNPIGEAVGAARVLSTVPVVHQGVLTGEVDQSMIGEGKRAAVLRVLAEHPSLDPQACYAYGDHPSDAPMMDCVGNARAVGDDPGLHTYLAQRASTAARDRIRGAAAFTCWSTGRAEHLVAGPGVCARAC